MSELERRRTRRDMLRSGGGLAMATLAGPTLLAACGSSDDSSGAASSKDAAKIAEFWAGPSLTKEKITLKVLRAEQDGPVEDLWNGWFEGFSRNHPNITVKSQLVNWDDLPTKIQALAASGADVPDVLYFDGPYVKSFAFYGVLAPLNDYFTKEYLDDILPSTFAEQSYDGKLYSMPYDASAQALYFNRDLFKKAGLRPPPETSTVEDGWTWDDFLDAGKKLTNGRVWGLASYGAGPGDNYYHDGIFVRGAGDKSASKDSSAYKAFAGISADGRSAVGYLDAPESQKGAQFFQDLYQTAAITPKAGVPDQFETGKAGLTVLDQTVIAVWPQLFPDLRFGVSPIPHYAGRKPFSHTGSITWAAAAKSKHPVEAAALLAYMHRNENAQAWIEVGGGLPARNSLYEDSKYEKHPYKLLKETAFNYAYARPSSPGTAQYLAGVNEAMRNIGLGSSPSEALPLAAQRITDDLDKLGF